MPKANIIESLRPKSMLSADGATASEIEEELGQSAHWVMKHLKALAKEGRLIVGRKRIFRIDGNPTSVPSYRLMPEKKR